MNSGEMLRNEPAEDLLYGAKAIGAFIGRSPEQAFHLLQRRLIPCGKIGDQWVASRSALRLHMAKIALGDVA
jgi:hypothetical protein